MLFSTGTFIYLFLPAVVVGYQLLSRYGRRARLGWFAFASFVFYAFWNPKFLILLGISILLNYSFALLIGRNSSERARSGWLTTAIASNLLLLMYFKYLFPMLGFLTEHGLLRHNFGSVLLPLGISFFTFTQIAYLIDLRQGIARQADLLSYSVFVTFFPHLIAGPIIHPRELMPQLDRDGSFGLRSPDVALGLSWFIMGLCKKVLIADVIAVHADKMFAAPNNFGRAASWLGALAYAMQLYFDFSGYSDMALGLARIFSIEFPVNFNSPYKSVCIIEFWQEWHMTLSRYLNEYLYTPILGNVNGRRMRAGKKVSRKAQATPEGFLQMVAFPVLTTMFIAGIWHGAGFNFLIFGLLHGSYLTINHAWRLFTPKGHRLHNVLPKPVSVLITFLAVLVGHVFFRSRNVSEACGILHTMVAGQRGVHDSLHALLPGIGELAICFVIIWAMPNTQEILKQVPHDETPRPSLIPWLNWQPTAAWSVGLMLLFCASILMLDSSTSFLYFQF